MMDSETVEIKPDMHTGLCWVLFVGCYLLADQSSA